MSVLHYQSTGAGPALVLLHGFCEDSFIWQHLLPDLSKKYQVITIDLPGFGESPMKYDAPTVLDYATSVQQTIQAIGLKEYVLIGHSFGGYISLEYARHFGEQLKGVGLFNSHAFADNEAKKATRTKSVEFIRTHGGEAFARSMFGNLFSPSNKEIMGDFMEQMAASIRKCDPENIIKAQLAMRGRQDTQSVLQELEIPVLFVAGKDDNSCTFDKSILQSELPKDAVCHFWGEVGHIGMFERPKKSLMALQNFMSYCFD